MLSIVWVIIFVCWINILSVLFPPNIVSTELLEIVFFVGCIFCTLHISSKIEFFQREMVALAWIDKIEKQDQLDISDRSIFTWMPALVAFGRRWSIASDDFVFPSLSEAIVRLSWSFFLKQFLAFWKQYYDSSVCRTKSFGDQIHIWFKKNTFERVF